MNVLFIFVILCGFFIIGYSAFCDSDNDEDQADISSKVGNLVGQMEVSGGEHDYLEGMIGNIEVCLCVII